MHGVALLAKPLDLNLPWADVVLQLVDFEVEDEFELLKLLDFLLQSQDLALGFQKSLLSVNDLLLLLLDVRFELNRLQLVVFKVNLAFLEHPEFFVLF